MNLTKQFTLVLFCSLCCSLSCAQEIQYKLKRINFHNPTLLGNKNHFTSINLRLNPIDFLKKGEYQNETIGLSADIKAYKVEINELKFDSVGKINLGENINSIYKELTPVISPDGQKLFFTRSNHPENKGADLKQDIWVSENNADEGFGKAVNLGGPINNKSHNSVFCINQNGRMLLNNYYYKDSLSKGVSLSYYQNKKWSFPKNLIIEDYYNYNKYSEFFLTEDDSVMMMTCERSDSYGGKDIYVSFRIDSLNYSIPTNLGEIINTAYGETGPFITTDGKFLLFSTEGHTGYGNNDIFISRRLDNTWLNWSEPVNLGKWINTPGWDAYISIPTDYSCIYTCSYTNSLGDADIFKIPLTEENRQILFGIK